MPRRSSPFIVRSLKSAWSDFLGATATGGFETNEGVFLHVLGHITVRDCSTFDGVRENYELKKACTAQQAFNACWNRKRDWRGFDLRSLQDCHEDFRHLGLPDKVNDALERESIQEESDRGEGNRRAANKEEYEEAPPLELLYRGGKSRRKRKSKSAPKSKREKIGTLKKIYRVAKKMYHETGEQLHWAKLKGDLL